MILRLAWLVSERNQGVVGSLMVIMIVVNFCMFASMVQFEYELSLNTNEVLSPHSGDNEDFRRRILLAKDSHDAAVAPSMDFDGDASFSSCLWVQEMDRNKLPEWLAYHFFTLNLRYLVVYLPDDADDDEATYRLLQKWKPFMNIASWTETSLTGAQSIRAQTKQTRRKGDEQTYQTQREASFYHKCAIHMQRNDRSLVSFHQVNEFAAINEEAITNAPTLVSEFGSIARLLQYAREQQNVTDVALCVSTVHTEFTAVGSPVDEVQADVPECLQGQRDNDMAFDTLRWRYARREPKYHLGKAFVNLSALSDIPPLRNNVDDHDSTLAQKNARRTGRRPYTFAPYCPRTLLQLGRPHAAIVRMHVYPHSPIISNKDLNSLPIAPLSKASAVVHKNMEVTPWLEAFVQQVGPETAKSLLESIVSVPRSTPMTMVG